MNIQDHEFDDCIAEMEVTQADSEKIIISFRGQWIFFSRADVEAMANHFNNQP